MVTTLESVRLAIQRKQNIKFSPIQVYIIGFDASQAHPWRFVYQGCAVRKENGSMCRKSVNGPFRCRLHHSFELGTWAYMYRFDLFLADSTLAKNAPPMRVTIFDHASTLLSMPAEVFADLSEVAQLLHVQKVSRRLHQMVTVNLSFNPRDPFPILQGLFLYEDSQHLSSCGSQGTPRALCVDQTAGSSSSRAQGTTSGKKDVRTMLLDIVEQLDDAHITEDA